MDGFQYFCDNQGMEYTSIFSSSISSRTWIALEMDSDHLRLVNKLGSCVEEALHFQCSILDVLGTGKVQVIGMLDNQEEMLENHLGKKH